MANGWRYRLAHDRVVALVAALPDDMAVPSTPAWNLRELLAHLAGAAVDLAGGNALEWSLPQWTEAQVRQRATSSRQDLLVEWAAAVDGVVERVDAPEAFGLYEAFTRMPVIDVVGHEHDIAEAAGLPAAIEADDWFVLHEHRRAKLDEAVKKLDADNQLMAKTYGYSILRNYVRVPEKSEVFIVLTPEELEKQAKPADGSEPAKTARVCVLADAQANQAFQSAVQSLQQLRQQAAALKVQLDAATTDKDKAYVQGQFDLAMKQLNEANAAATKAYAFNLNRQYVMSIERSSLYVAATAEEAEQASKAAAGK